MHVNTTKLTIHSGSSLNQNPDDATVCTDISLISSQNTAAVFLHSVDLCNKPV